MTKLFAALGIVVGGIDTILSLAVAFGVHVTPDQHTAIASASGLLLVVLGVWLHPAIPVGNKTP